MTQSRGCTWLAALAGTDGCLDGVPNTVRIADAPLGGESVRFIAVTPDPANRFPRARHGEVGLEEAWHLADQVRKTMLSDAGKSPRTIIAIVDVSSQAYGRVEELCGLHAACGAAVDAYATARLAGHAIIALLVGKAMSGAFLAHGYQANRLVALDDPGVVVNAMGKLAAARVTRRSVDELDAMAEQCPPMASDVRTFARWGLLHQLIGDVNADQPGAADIAKVRDVLIEAIADTRCSARDLRNRLPSDCKVGRAASRVVRARMAEQWDDH